MENEHPVAGARSVQGGASAQTCTCKPHDSILVFTLRRERAQMFFSLLISNVREPLLNFPLAGSQVSCMEI